MKQYVLATDSEEAQLARTSVANGSELVGCYTTRRLVPAQCTAI